MSRTFETVKWNIFHKPGERINMNRKFRPLFVLLILALLVAACGGKESPTDTPKPTQPPPPPTDTPVPPPTAIPALELSAEALRSEAGGYALNYPDGWEYFDTGGGS